MRTRLFIAAAVACAVALSGCWSSLPRQGASGTCANNSFRLSGATWPDGVYTPEVGYSFRPKQETWFYAFDVWQDSYNTCGIPDDDRILVTPADAYLSMCVGHSCQDGHNQVMDVDRSGACAGSVGCAYTYSAWGVLVEADIFTDGAYLNAVDNRKVNMHEVGHAIGLCHNGACLPNGGYLADGNIMGYTSSAGEQLGRGDLSGLHLMYGGHTH